MSRSLFFTDLLAHALFAHTGHLRLHVGNHGTLSLAAPHVRGTRGLGGTVPTHLTPATVGIPDCQACTAVRFKVPRTHRDRLGHHLQRERVYSQ